MINPDRVYKCFGENFIGIRGYCDSHSESGYFINDLPNISIKGLARVATEEDVKGKRLFDRILRNAIVDTAKTYIKYLNKYGKVRAIRDISKTSTVNLCGNQVLKITPKNNHQRISIVKVDTRGSKEKMFVHDGLNTYEMKTNKGVHYLDYQGESKDLYIYFNNCELSIIDDLPDCECEEKCCFSCLDYCASSCECFEYELGEIPSKESSCNYCISFSCECSYDEIVCMNRMLLADAIYNKTAELFFLEKYVSNNLDPYIQGTKEEANEWAASYRIDFEEDVKSAVDFSKNGLSKLSKCFVCSGTRVVKLNM